jgi:hypothetical protein
MARSGEHRKGHTIASLEDARRDIVHILAEINADPSLAIAAAANPLFALEDLGYQVTPEAHTEIADYVRFGATKAARLRKLRKTIYDAAGQSVDLQSEVSLRDLLENLRTPSGKPLGGKALRRGALAEITVARSPQVKWAVRDEDPLEAFRGKHPVVDALLEYRQIEASEPRLATRAVYDEIRQGKKRTPLVSVRAVLRKSGK